jgi:hypothetical protein
VGALFKIPDETALTCGVGRQPARGAVELARLVQHCLEGVLVTLVPLTAAHCPRASLVSGHSLLKPVEFSANASLKWSHMLVCRVGRLA